MRSLMTTGALLTLLGNPAAMAQTIGGGTSSVEPASPAVSSSLTLDARLIGGTRAGQEVFIDRLATGWPLPLRPAEPPTGGPSGIETFWPIEGISYQLGSKRAVGYFEPRNGKCQVTLMIAEAVDPDQA